MKVRKVALVFFLIAAILSAVYFLYPVLLHKPFPTSQILVLLGRKSVFDSSKKSALNPWAVSDAPKTPNDAAVRFRNIMERSEVAFNLKRLGENEGQIISQVYSFDSYNKTAVIGIIESLNPAVTGAKTVKVSCPENTTALFKRPYFDYADTTFPVFEKMNIGDVLVTYCTNTDCSEVGKECILIGK